MLDREGASLGWEPEEGLRERGESCPGRPVLTRGTESMNRVNLPVDKATGRMGPRRGEACQQPEREGSAVQTALGLSPATPQRHPQARGPGAAHPSSSCSNLWPPAKLGAQRPWVWKAGAAAVQAPAAPLAHSSTPRPGRSLPLTSWLPWALPSVSDAECDRGWPSLPPEAPLSWGGPRWGTPQTPLRGQAVCSQKESLAVADSTRNSRQRQASADCPQPGADLSRCLLQMTRRHLQEPKLW